MQSNPVARYRKYRSFPRLGECAKSDPLLPFLVDPGTEGVRQDRLFREQAPNAPVRPNCLQDLLHVSQ